MINCAVEHQEAEQVPSTISCHSCNNISYRYLEQCNLRGCLPASIQRWLLNLCRQKLQQPVTRIRSSPRDPAASNANSNLCSPHNRLCFAMCWIHAGGTVRPLFFLTLLIIIPSAPQHQKYQTCCHEVASPHATVKPSKPLAPYFALGNNSQLGHNVTLR
jgi:hypothetical protein